MQDLTFIYFEGCPKAKEAQRLLEKSGISFRSYDQSQLESDNPLRAYSSPTILRGEEIIFGAKLTQKSSGCTFSSFNENEILRKLKE